MLLAFYYGYAELGSIARDVQRLAPGFLITLFELDSTHIPGGTVLRWHNGVNALGADVIWDGNTYSRHPVEASGFERNSKGTMPSPRLRSGNITGLLGAYARESQDLLGTRVTRRRTLLKYLDAVNFSGGVNPTADPSGAWPDEVWFIARKLSEDEMFIEFELSSSFDVRGIRLPRRQCIQNTCPWKYRSAECGYSGGPVADISDNPTFDPSLDSCGKRLASCRIRFGAHNELNFGGVPGVGLVR